MRPRVRKMVMLSPLFLVGFAAFVAIGGWIVKLLWNALLPPLFGWHAVTLWQALGLLVLCRILFGNFGAGRAAGSRAGRRAAENWATLTPEERERFRQRMHERWGTDPMGGAPPAP